MSKRAVQKWGSVPEAAERRSVSTYTIRRYISQGLVYAERVGPKLIRVDLDSVDALGTPLQYTGGDSDALVQSR
jgi:hypothetical protein